MATKTTIEWTEMTWNPVTGCTKVSDGCRHCYAERLALRLRAMGCRRYVNGFDVTLHDDLVDLPRTWRQPRLIFVNSMSDLFHEAVPEEFIGRVFETMAACPQHTFQVLTKRSRRLRDMAQRLPWPKNVWVGVSVENERALGRIDDLRPVPASVRFLSCEPLLGPLEGLDLEGIAWVIVGGESGPGARPMKAEWVEAVLSQCRRAKVAFFFKQWGGVRKDRTGRELNGRTYDEWPLALGLISEREHTILTKDTSDGSKSFIEEHDLQRIQTMNVTELERKPELLRVLLACYECWKLSSLPPEQRFICYSWVSGTYRQLFGGEFHQAKLYQLTKLGFLKQDDTSRGDHRRYYKIADPALVEALARKWGSLAE